MDTNSTSLPSLKLLFPNGCFWSQPILTFSTFHKELRNNSAATRPDNLIILMRSREVEKCLSMQSNGFYFQNTRFEEPQGN